MNLKKLLLMLTIFVLMGTTVFAQLQTVYVDYTNGNDVTNSGANPDNSVLNEGPVKTITVGLTKVAEGGTLVIFATTSGLYEYGNVTVNKQVTLQAKVNPSGPFSEVSIANLDFNDGTAPKGPFTITSDGTAFFNVGTKITLTSGNVSISNAADLRIASSGTIDMYQGDAAFSNLAPQKGSNLNLTYSGSKTAIAGPEAAYGSYGSGVLTLTHTAGTVTIGSNVSFKGIVSNDVGSTIFSGTVSNDLFDIANSGSGTLTFNNSVNLRVDDGGVSDAKIGSIENTGTGKIIVNGTTTWSFDKETAGARDFTGAGLWAILNDPGSNAGAIEINGGITLSITSDTDQFYTIYAKNLATAFNGSMIVGNVTAATNAEDVYAILQIDNQSTGTLTLKGGALKGNVLNTAAGKVVFDGATTVTGNLTNTTTGIIEVKSATSVGGLFTDNGAAGEVKLTGANLTLSNTGSVNQAHTTSTGSFTGTGSLILAGGKSAQTRSINGGAISNLQVASGAIAWSNITNPLTISGSLSVAGAFNAATNVTVAGTTTVSGGTFDLGGAAVAGVTLTTLNFSQTGGTVQFTANGANTRTVDVNGNFSRTGGAFSSTNVASRLWFTGTTNQTFNPGASLKVGQVKFDAPFRTIDVQQSLEALDALEITANTTVNLGNYNLNLSGASIATNNGLYTSTGGGGVQFLGAGGSMRGDHPYSNVIIASTGNVLVDLDDVTWTGQLTLNTAGIVVNDGVNDATNVDLSPEGTTARIVRNLAVAGTVITPATDGTTMGTFNGDAVNYDLEYIGTLTADRAVGSEFNTLYVDDFIVNVNKNTGAGPFQVQLPADPLNSNAAQTITLNGNLTIGPNAWLTIPTDAAAITFDLIKDGGAHSIRGEFSVTDATDVLQISGASATLTGATATGDVALVDNFVGNSTTGLTISGLKGLTGTFTTGANSVVSLGMGSTAATQAITGLVTIGGASFVMTTDLEAKAGVTHNTGSFAFGGNDLTLTTGGNFTRANDATAVYTSTGGKLITEVAGNYDFNGGTIPYWTIDGVAATLADGAADGADVVVGELLNIMAGGSIVNGGFDVTIEKNMTTVGGNVFTGTGALILAGTTVTASGNPNFSNMEVDSDSIATLASSSSTANRTFGITGVLTLTAGELAIGKNSVSLSGAGGAFVRTDGTLTASSGQLIFAGAAAQTAAQGDGFTVPNLTINNTGGVSPQVTFDGGATEEFTVTGTLKLTDGDLSSTADDILHLGSGATISIDNANCALIDAPVFDGTINYIYTTTATTATGIELTTSQTKITNMEIAATAGQQVDLSEDTYVNGTLTLTSGTLDENGNDLIIGSGATIVVNAGVLDDVPTVTNYNLTYTANNNDADEFVSGKVDLLTVENATLTLVGDRTVKDISLIEESPAVNTIACGVNNLTVTGNLNMSNGNITGTGNLILGGTTAQTFTVPTAGFALNADLKLDNAAGFTLAGGNLTINNDLIFISGVMSTGLTNAVVLTQTATGQGFDHTGVVAPAVSHINGNVRHAITAGAGSPTVYANGRYEFPVGTPTQFRPFAITFSGTYPAISPTNVTVNMVNASPEGTKNLPITTGALKIGSYPNYYWLVKTSPSSFTSTQLFDLEMQGTNIGIPYTSDQDLRIIKRQDGASTSNGWSLQNGSTYANYSIYNSDTDTTAVVRTTASIGGIVNEGTRFSIGVPARLPVWSPTQVSSLTVAEAQTTNNTIQLSATANNAGETLVYSLATNAPAWATLSTTTPGLITLTPTYGDYKATPYVFQAIVTTSTGLAASLDISITVSKSFRPPVFTGTGTSIPATPQSVIHGKTLSLTYVAVDPDPNDPPKYTVVSDPVPSGTVSISQDLGVLTFIPAFTDAGKSFTFTVTATSTLAATQTATAQTVVNVTYDAARLGDVDNSGSVTSADASLILQYVVNKITFTDEQKYYANVNGDTQVGALDAAWILYKAINGTYPLAKEVAASGTVEFGKIAAEKGVFNLPVSLQNTNGVLSLYTEVQIGAAVEFKGVSSKLPEGWQIASNFENGTLKIAMAGVTPLTGGNVANISLALQSKEASASVQGSVVMNDQLAQTLIAVKIKEIPTEFSLSQNYPNPFNPTTSIKYAIPQDAKVSLVVYNILGQVVKTLVDAEQESGYYTIKWDGTNDFGSKVTSGIYIYRINAGNYISTSKMNLLK